MILSAKAKVGQRATVATSEPPARKVWEFSDGQRRLIDDPFSGEHFDDGFGSAGFRVAQGNIDSVVIIYAAAEETPFTRQWTYVAELLLDSSNIDTILVKSLPDLLSLLPSFAALITVAGQPSLESRSRPSSKGRVR